MSAADLAPHRIRAAQRKSLWVPLSLLIVALGCAPLFGLPSFLQSLVIEILIFSLLSLSLNILVGYTGLVSFGHAAFFAVAGYAAGIVAARVTSDVLVTFPAGIAAAVAFALPLGWLSIRLSGFYFLMITFAFAQMVFVAAFRWKDVTGGSDGLLFPSPTLFGAPVLQDRTQFYVATVIIFALCCIAMYAIVSSAFGRVLIGIRESAPRMRAIGYNVRRYKLAAFVIAAAFAGVAGVLNAQFNVFIAPESAHWTQSALALVMVLIGGTGYFVGPIIGTAVVLLLQHGLSSYTEYWGLVLGLLFIVLITGAREGIAGLTVSGFRKLRGRA